MNLSDLIEIAKGNRRVSDMTFPLSQVRLNLSDRSEAFYRNRCLALSFYFWDCVKADYWKRGIAYFTPVSPCVRNRKGRLTGEETFRLLWDDDYAAYDYAMLSARYEEPRLNWGSITERPTACQAFMRDFHVSAAETLSSRGVLDQEEVLSVIERLLGEYK